MGKPIPIYRDTASPNALLLSWWREVGELKYLSSRRREINKDSHSSDERTGISPNHICGVVGPQYLTHIYRRTLWKERPQKVIALYAKYICVGRGSLSRVGHVKSGLNLGGPPSKAKELTRSIVNKYREGKVKRTPGRGVK